jgi:hypothetical protein
MSNKDSQDSQVNNFPPAKTANPVKKSWHLGCSPFQGMGAKLLQIRWLRRLWHIWERTPPFLKVVFSKEGIPSKKGRTLIWGKFRRAGLSLFPSVAHRLQVHYGMTGGCEHCSTSCKLLFQCPHWDDTSSRCSVYEDRPNICRTFPITPQDIADRDLVSPNSSCGFKFKKNP